MRTMRFDPPCGPFARFVPVREKPRLMKFDRKLWCCVGLAPIPWWSIGYQPRRIVTRYGVTPEHADRCWRSALRGEG